MENKYSSENMLDSYTRKEINDVAYLMYKGYSQCAIGKKLGIVEYRIQKLSTIVMSEYRWNTEVPVKTYSFEQISKIEDELFMLLELYNTKVQMNFDQLSRMNHLATIYALGQC